MQPLPHHYTVSAEAAPSGAVTLGSSGVERARKLLAKAEEVCLISNSLKGSHRLEAEVVLV